MLSPKMLCMCEEGPEKKDLKGIKRGRSPKDDRRPHESVKYWNCGKRGHVKKEFRVKKKNVDSSTEQSSDDDYDVVYFC